MADTIVKLNRMARKDWRTLMFSPSKGAIMALGDEETVDVRVVSTGSLALDQALGIGGYPRGRIVEI